MNDILFKILLPMCLTGCLFALGTLLVFPLLRRLGARWRRRVLLAAATLFILPLPLLFLAQPGQAAPQGTPQPTLTEALQQAAPTAPAYQAGQALNTATRPQQSPAGGNESEAGKTFSFSLPGALAFLYLAGLGTFALVTGVRNARFARRLRRTCVPVSPQSPEAALLADLCEEMELRRPPRLYRSDALPSPVLVGLLRPRIVLPGAATSEARWKWALRHELTHLKQRDLPAKAFLLAVSAVHWWCPALPALRRAFSSACEDACDERVAAGLSGGQRKEYAGTLLHFAGGALPYATAGLALPAKNLRRRLQRLIWPLRPSRMLQAVGLTLLAVVLCVGLLMGCGFAAGAVAPSAVSSSVPASSVPSAEGDPILAWPLPDYTETSRDFEEEEHPGFDIPAPEGTPVLACTEGTVTAAAFSEDYGNYITLDHGDGLTTLYAHCSALFVNEGGTVGAKQPIAAVGATGEASEPMLYLEVQKDGVAVDPLYFVSLESPALSDPATGESSPAQSDAAAGYAWPVPGYTGMSRGFVANIHPGLDLNAPPDTPILATATGTVITAEYSERYGNYIIIDHGGGVETLYAQCAELKVEVGQTVEQNSVIATVGSTGYSTGPHLHFEILIDGESVDPMGYVSAPPMGGGLPAQSDVSATGYVWPVPDWTGMTRGFTSTAHIGIDLTAPEGAPVLACAAGEVEKAEFNRSYGNLILLRHADGMRTLYAHCKELYVEPGDTVKPGDKIAAVGSTGYSTGPHTHVEFITEEKLDGEISGIPSAAYAILDGKRVDPIDFLTPPS